MRVLYDGVIYRIQKYGGVVRYFNDLIHHLPASVHPILLAPNRPAVPPTHPNLSTFIETCESILWPIKPLRKKIIARRSYNRILREKPDVIHPTYYYSSLRNLNQRIKTPTVLTVYDLIHERFPAQMDPYGKQVKLKKMALERADAIICISESTKADLQKYYRIPDERITVIHLGCEFNAIQNPPEAAERPYLLYVGERNFYKNFERTAEAFAKVHQAHPELQLRCIGGQEFSAAENRMFHEHGIQDSITRAGHIEDGLIQKVYAQAVAVVYPSLYEGFGIPILEGMTCGTPVLTSNRSSMPEVAGDAAILFDPYSCDQIAEAMMAVVEDAGLRQRLIEAGRKRAQSFSLTKSANATLEVYQSVSGKTSRQKSGVAA